VIRGVILDHQTVECGAIARILGPVTASRWSPGAGWRRGVAASIDRHQPDAVLMDIRMRRVDGITAIPAPPACARGRPGRGPDRRSTGGRQRSRLARPQGGAGCPPPVPVKRPIAYGRGGRIDALTDREHDVPCHMARWVTNSEIAAALFIGEPAVNSHVGSILSKLGRRDRAAAIVFADDHGIVDSRTG
jgi:DNA-binding NarL/FixJ family response regulator